MAKCLFWPGTTPNRAILRLHSGQVLVGDPQTGLFRVIARKLRPKWRAKRLLAHIPDAQIWIDSPRILRHAQDKLWAVLAPVNEEFEHD